MLQELCKIVPSNISLTNEDKFPQSIFEKIRGPNPLIEIISPQDSKNKRAGAKDHNEVIKTYEDTMTPILTWLWAAFFVALFCNLGLFYISHRVDKKSFRFLWIAKLSETDKKYLVGFNLILLILLLLLGISGLALSSRLEKATHHSLCAWYNLLTNVEQGSPANNWFGLTPLLNSLRSLDESVLLMRRNAEKLRDISRNSLEPFGDFLQKKASSNSISNIHEISRADPAITDPYIPDFILNSVRLNQSTPSDAQRILDELNLYYRNFQGPVSSILKEWESSLEYPLFKTINPTSAAINKALIDFQSLASFSREYSQTIKAASDHSQISFKLISLGICLVFSISLLFWGLPLKLKIRFARFLKIGWWLFSGLSMLSWSIFLITLPMNIRFMETCGVLKKNLEDPAFFTKTMNLFVDQQSSANKFLETCLHSNANIFSTFGLQEHYGDYKDFEYFHPQNSLDYRLEELAKRSTQISALTKKLEQWRSGILSDSHETDADFKKLNSLTMVETSCGTIKDTWVLNTVNCTKDMGEKFTARSASDFNVGNPTCIGFSQWMAFAGKSIAERYEIKDCDDNKSRRIMRSAQKFIEGFVENRGELETLLLEILMNSDEIATKYEDYRNSLEDFSKISHEIEKNWEAFHKTLYEKQVGIMSNMKCHIIKKDLQDFEKSFCMGFVPASFELSTIILVVSVILTLTAWSMFFLAKNVLEGDLSFKLERSKKERRKD